MKSLTVLILCSFCCVNAYRIFPLPGQNVESNTKFASLGQPALRSIGQTTKAPEVNSRLTNFTQRPSFAVQSGTQYKASEPQQKTTFGNFARTLNTAQTVPLTFQSLTDVKILNRPSSKPQNFAVASLANDLLPPKEDSKPGLPTKVIDNTVPPRPTVAVPFNDLLPPKIS